MAEYAKRRKLSKADRLKVYQKCGGHCAYCGASLRYEDMQVDHVIPINGWNQSGPDTHDNMLPACRSCNHYKAQSPLESFRRMIEAQPKVLQRDSTTYQIAVRYGLVIPAPRPVEFYFERIAAVQEGAPHD